MNLDELFDGVVKVRITYRDKLTVHTLREPKSPEWLEYQRRNSNFRFNKKQITATEESVGARLWLYDLTAQKVEVMDDGVLVDIPDFKNKIPAMLKDAAASAFIAQIRLPDDEEGN